VHYISSFDSYSLMSERSDLLSYNFAIKVRNCKNQFVLNRILETGQICYCLCKIRDEDRNGTRPVVSVLAYHPKGSEFDSDYFH
jgi:hypothetical protein